MKSKNIMSSLKIGIEQCIAIQKNCPFYIKNQKSKIEIEKGIIK